MKHSISDNNTANNKKSKIAPQSSSSGKRNFNMIPSDDLMWAMEQNPAVIRLFHEGWVCDPYGSRWMQLNTKLKDRAFRDAKKKLSDQGLFVFKRETSIQDSRSTVCWMIKNLHGSRVKGYWDDCKAEFLGGTDAPDCGTTMPECSTLMPVFGTAMPSISPQIQSEQGFQKRSTSSQHHIYDQQHFNIAEDGVAVDLKAFEKKEEELTKADLPNLVLERSAAPVAPNVVPSPVDLTDEQEALNEMRRLGIERNDTTLPLMKKYAANVPNAIAYLKEYQGTGKDFANITGAFVDALKKGKKPIDTEPSFGLHKELNPPTEPQLAALEEARNKRLILDYFFSSIDNTHKVILLDGITQSPWWEYLNS